MRTTIFTIIGVVLLAGCQTNAPRPEYTILETKSPYGQTVYGLACANGTSNCNYNWSTLCEKGTPYNTTPIGGKGDDVPSFAVMNGQRVRIFVCL